MKNDACIVIPSWNARKFIDITLKSLQKMHTDVVVIDNGSSDGTEDFLHKNFPETVVLRNKTNLGFAGGVNVGISYALKHGYKFVALFNNDAVADENWLKELVEVMNCNKQCGIVTSKILLDDKKHLDSTGDFYTIYGIPFPRGRHELDHKQYDKEINVFGASGGASLYRVEMLRAVGFFDDDFFAYYEDVDISFRAQQAGWKVLYEPKAIVYHQLSQTSSRLGKKFTYYHSIKNMCLLYDRNMPARLYWKYLPLFSYKLLRAFVGSFKHGSTLVFLKAIWKVTLLTPRTLAIRRERKRKRVVSVKQIDNMLVRAQPPKVPELTA